MAQPEADQFAGLKLDAAMIQQIGTTLQKLNQADGRLSGLTDRYLVLDAKRRQELYETDPWIGQLIDWLPDAMCQKWVRYSVSEEIEADGGDGEGGEVFPYENELSLIQEDIKDALKIARIHGYSALMLYVDDGQLPSEAMNERAIRSIDGFSVFVGGDGGQISVATWQDDKLKPNYGKPILFDLGDTYVHHSRLLLFYGVKKLCPFSLGQKLNLGESLIDRAYGAWKDFVKGGGMIAQNLHKSSQRILKIKGFKQLATNKTDLEAYIAGMAYALDVLGIMAIDADDADFNVVEHNYNGVPELLKHFKTLFGGAANMMHTDMFGESPSGQTSGSYQDKWKSGFVHAAQEAELRRPLLKYLRYLHLRDGTNPEDGNLDFPALYEIDDQQRADVIQKQASGLRSLVGAASGPILTPDEAAQFLAQYPEYQSVIDTQQRQQEALLEQQPEGFIIGTPSTGEN